MLHVEPVICRTQTSQQTDSHPNLHSHSSPSLLWSDEPLFFYRISHQCFTSYSESFLCTLPWRYNSCMYHLDISR